MSWIAAVLMALLGARLFVLASTNRALPELLLAGFFFLVGISGPLLGQAEAPGSIPFAETQRNLLLGHLGLSLGFACLYLFNWRSFGPDSSWRRAVAIGGIAALAWAFACQGIFDDFHASGGAGTIASVFVRVVGICWAFGEASHMVQQMRRRKRVGLADPVVANRFLLWAIWTGSMAAVMATALASRLMVQLSTAFEADALLALFRSFVGVPVIAACVALCLSFFPPAAYLRRLGSRQV